jgi:hypothetical protein
VAHRAGSPPPDRNARQPPALTVSLPRFFGAGPSLV